MFASFGEASDTEFVPAICDEILGSSSTHEWQRDANFPGHRYALGINWRERTINPQTTDLDLYVVLVIDIGRPWQQMYEQLKDAAQAQNRCESQVQLTQFNILTTSNSELAMHGRVEIDYWVCAFERHQLMLGNQSFDFYMKIRPTAANGIISLIVEPRFEHGPLPAGASFAFNTLGVLKGALFTPPYGIGGGIRGGMQANTDLNAQYNASLEQIRRTMEGMRNSKNQTIPAVSLVEDYQPTFVRPFLTYEILAENPPNVTNLLVHFPMRMQIPNVQSCDVKQMVQSWSSKVNLGAPLESLGFSSVNWNEVPSVFRQ